MLRATCRLLRVLPSALVLCTVGPVTLAAQAFEGSVTMRVNLGARASAQTGAAATQQLEYQVRGGKVRVNMGGPMGGMAMLAVPQERKLYMLMAAQQAYMEMPLAEAASAASSAGGARQGDADRHMHYDGTRAVCRPGAGDARRGRSGMAEADR
jgi:hypothetical protein